MKTKAPGILTEKQKAKRKEIIDTASVLFLQEGYEGLSMDRVQQKVGGSKRTLYQHFKNKDELFATIVTNISDRVLAALDTDIEKTHDIRVTLQIMGERYLDVLLSPDGLALYRAVASSAVCFPELSKTFFKNGPDRASRHLSKIFRNEMNAGRLHIVSPDLAAGQFLGAVRGDLHLACIFAARKPTRKAIKDAVKHAVGIFLAGTRPYPHPSA